MNEFINIDSWMDVVDHLWIGVVLITVTAIPAWFSNRNHKAIKSVGQKADTLVGSVQNSHTVPMRDDLDRAISAIESLGHDVRGLRQDVASLDDVRRQQIADLRSDLEHRIGRRHP